MNSGRPLNRREIKKRSNQPGVRAEPHDIPRGYGHPSQKRQLNLQLIAKELAATNKVANSKQASRLLKHQLQWRILENVPRNKESRPENIALELLKKSCVIEGILREKESTGQLYHFFKWQPI
jgi:hypothetical protein